MLRFGLTARPRPLQTSFSTPLAIERGEPAPTNRTVLARTLLVRACSRPQSNPAAREHRRPRRTTCVSTSQKGCRSCTTTFKTLMIPCRHVRMRFNNMIPCRHVRMMRFNNGFARHHAANGRYVPVRIAAGQGRTPISGLPFLVIIIARRLTRWCCWSMYAWAHTLLFLFLKSTHVWRGRKE
jgi:hypothetical protein